jgi:hypothetical protein
MDTWDELVKRDFYCCVPDWVILDWIFKVGYSVLDILGLDVSVR